MNAEILVKIACWFALLATWIFLIYLNSPLYAPIITTITLALGAVSHNLAATLNAPQPEAAKPTPVAQQAAVIAVPAAPAAPTNP